MASARKFAVTGTSGSGKTTTGRTLAAQLEVPFLQLDSVNHLAEWEQSSDELFRQTVEDFTSGDAWVVDGTYHNRIGTLVWERADTLVWLDLPIRVWLSRLVRRVARDIATKRDLYNGNTQTLRWAFPLVWMALVAHFRRRRDVPSLFETLPQLNVVRLRSPSEVERWLSAQRS